MPHFQQPEVANILQILEDVEEQAFGFGTALVPHGAMSIFPLIDEMRVDVKVDEEGHLRISRCHGCGSNVQVARWLVKAHLIYMRSLKPDLYGTYVCRLEGL